MTPNKSFSVNDTLKSPFLRVMAEGNGRQRALVEVQKKYESLFEIAKEAIYISTPDGKFLDINPSGVSLFGYKSKEEMLNIDISREIYYDPQDRIAFQALLQENGFVEDYELELKTKSGEKLFVLVTAVAIHDNAGKVVQYQGIIYDLTRNRNLEQQLLQSQKMENLGRLVSGVAHDFNNLLTVILGNTDFALQTCSPEDETYHDLISVRDAAVQARALTTQLLKFSMSQEFLPKPVDLNAIVETHVKLFSSVIGKHITVVTHLDSKLRHIQADTGQIQQILMNLSLNARDAMPGGGTLAIATHNVIGQPEVVDHRDVICDFSTEGDGYVELSVSDTGIGLDDDTKDRMFEPFFTTKQNERGTGLGLAVVESIIKSHRGLLACESQPGRGTTFKVYLPVAAVSETLPPNERRKKIIRGRGETILLVEDEDNVREVATRLLHNLGYKVLAAKDGNMALEVFEKNQKEIDLAILDVVMPGASGPDIFISLRSKKADLPIIFVSGYEVAARSRISENVENDADFITVLPKPFTVETLSAKVREMLDASANGKDQGSNYR